MKRNVICISRSLAAGGEEIARLIADETGFRYTDDEIIVAAAQELGVSPEQVAEVESTPGLVGRILSALRSAPLPEGYTVLPSGLPTSYKHLIEQVLRGAADQGDVVIVAHGGSFALADRTQVLRVLVTAPPSVRALRLVDQAGMSDEEAKRSVAESDVQRERYLRRFYHIEHELPTHYDLVVNTEHLTPTLAAQIIVSVAGG